MTEELEQLTEKEVDSYLEKIPFERWKRKYSERISEGRGDFISKTEFHTRINKRGLRLDIRLCNHYFKVDKSESDGVLYGGYVINSYSTKIICSGHEIYETEDNRAAEKRYQIVASEFGRRKEEKERTIEKERADKEITRQKEKRSRIRDILSKLR